MPDECECGGNCPVCEECGRPECQCVCDGDLEVDDYPYHAFDSNEEDVELYS